MQRSNLKRNILPLWLLSTLVLASNCGKKHTPISSNEVAVATKPKPLAQPLPAATALKLPEEGVNVPVTAAVQPTKEQQQQTVSSIQPVSNNSSNSQQQSEVEKDPISITEMKNFLSWFSTFFDDSAC
ncbi:hypothetical protein [Candidatus Cardinium hertigii]|uniref:Uncharacterized protein n=1 Tax=Candidatus Cardinium hertigii TaxID=247481 RepID=A0A2Z3L9J8_9BACT|nr:hypothetical protein [Candidatus Cardinium hertigii]AWN82039.1 hypothetical protein DK880_00729 [Candidatus Cardinium hertigii]